MSAPVESDVGAAGVNRYSVASVQWRTMTAWRLASVCCLAVYMSYAVTSGRTCWKEACRHRASHHSRNGLRPIEPAVVNTTATKCLSMDLHPFSCLSIFLASAAYSEYLNLRCSPGCDNLQNGGQTDSRRQWLGPLTTRMGCRMWRAPDTPTTA